MLVEVDRRVERVHEGRAVFQEIGHDVEDPLLEMPVRVEMVARFADLLDRDLVLLRRRLEDLLFQELSIAAPSSPGRDRRIPSRSARRRRSPG